MITITNNINKVSTEPHEFTHVVQDTIVYITEPIDNFNPLTFELVCNQLHEYQCGLIYSFDNQNWSKEYPLEVGVPLDNASTEFIENILHNRDLNFFPTLYIGVKLTRAEEFYSNGNVNFDENVPDTDYPHIDVVSIIHDGMTYANDLLRFEHSIHTLTIVFPSGIYTITCMLL